MAVTRTYDNLEPGLKKYAKKAPLKITSALTGDSVHFAAFLTSLSQNFASNWSTEEVYGRNDPIASFQSTKRQYQVAFDIPSANVTAAKDALKGCNQLAKFLYPGYIDPGEGYNGRIIARPPLVKVQFANLISNGNDGPLLGWLEGLDWTTNLEMGMFHEGSKVYPKVISLSFTFNVLHQKDLGWNSGNGWNGGTLIG